METLIRSIDPRQLLILPIVAWGRNGALPRSLIEERRLYEQARGARILRRIFAGVKGHKIWSVENRRMNPPRFYGLGRSERQIVGGRKTPPYGRYEIWSQVELQPNADSRIFIIFAADMTILDEAEWRNRKIFQEVAREAVKRPARMATYVMDFSAENNWNNPYWEGINVTHLLGPLK